MGVIVVYWTIGSRGYLSVCICYGGYIYVKWIVWCCLDRMLGYRDMRFSLLHTYQGGIKIKCEETNSGRGSISYL